MPVPVPYRTEQLTADQCALFCSSEPFAMAIDEVLEQMDTNDLKAGVIQYHHYRDQCHALHAKIRNMTDTLMELKNTKSKPSAISRQLTLSAASTLISDGLKVN